MRTPFLGSAYVSRSSNAADNQCINLYMEVNETKEGKDVGAFYGCPGLTMKDTWEAGPIRAMHEFDANDALVVVSGDKLCINDGAGHRVLGTIGGPGTGWSWNSQTDTFSQITLPFTPDTTNSDFPEAVTIVDNGIQVGVFVGISAAEQDGFVLIDQPDTSLFFQSALLDLTTWDALNFGDASGHPDNIVALAQIHREMFVIMQSNTEVWVNIGTPGFVFQRLDGVFIEAGCCAPKSVVQVGQTLMWLARNLQGQGIVVQCTGYTTSPVSTHFIERELQSYGDLSTAVAYSYQQEGHTFYVLSIPSGDATWVYDVTESQKAGVPLWHNRAIFDNTTGMLHRHWGNAYVLIPGGAGSGDAAENLIGDYRNGNLYRLDLNALTDNGTQRKWLRSWRALPKPAEEPTRFNSLRIDMQTGIGVAPTDNPQAVLRWSDDGGHIWSNERFAAVGKTGETARRVMYRRLGSTRRNSGLDRIFELSSTDQFPVALIGAELE